MSEDSETHLYWNQSIWPWLERMHSQVRLQLGLLMTEASSEQTIMKWQVYDIMEIDGKLQ